VDGQLPIATYPVSTSKFCISTQHGTNGTPLGKHQVVKKIGGGLPLGAVLKSRRPTGEVLQPNAPGRDPIVTRILWLNGLEPENQNSYERNIYIHGTPEERTIGNPASFGCIRMRSKDVAELYDRLGVGSEVTIVNRPVSGEIAAMQLFVKEAEKARIAAMKKPLKPGEMQPIATVAALDSKSNAKGDAAKPVTKLKEKGADPKVPTKDAAPKPEATGTAKPTEKTADEPKGEAPKPGDAQTPVTEPPDTKTPSAQETPAEAKKPEESKPAEEKKEEAPAPAPAGEPAKS
jgi:hypothetical protein